MPTLTEVAVWNEGSAYIRTGNASSLVAFGRGMQLRLVRGFYVYRPPHSNTYEGLETGRVATLTINQAFSQLSAITMFEGATAGGFRIHLIRKVPSLDESAGFHLYSGFLQALTHAGSPNNAYRLSFQAQFHEWSTY